MHIVIFSKSEYIVIILGAAAANIWANCFSPHWWWALNTPIHSRVALKDSLLDPNFYFLKFHGQAQKDRRVDFFFSPVILDLLFRYVEKKKKKHTTWSGYIFTLSHGWFVFEGWKSWLIHARRVMVFSSSLKFTLQPIFAQKVFWRLITGDAGQLLVKCLPFQRAG